MEQRKKRITKRPDMERYRWDANPWVWVIEFERCEKPEEEDKVHISELAKFMAEMIFSEKETVLEILKSEDYKSLEDEIYYCLENCAE